MPNGYAKRIEDRPEWVCATCGKTARPTVHQMRKTYCSSECMAKGYSTRLRGDQNPNYRGASERSCENCGEGFHSYQKAKYCSRGCYTESRNNTREKECKNCGTSFVPRFYGQKLCDTGCTLTPSPMLGPKMDGRRFRHPKMYKKCCLCGESFKYSKSQASRKYCSYKCFNRDGGNLRAGLASLKNRMKYGAKKDANHDEVFEAIRKHTAANDFSSAGRGIPDGVAWIDGGWQFFDVKNPETSYGKKGLNKLQKDWASKWNGGPVYLIYTAKEGEQFARGDYKGIKCYPPEKHPLYKE